MLQYLIILLDKASVPFCNYGADQGESNPISIDNLRKAILFAMKHNLNIQFVYPHRKLGPEYKQLIDSIDHADIKPAECASKDTDVVVFHSLTHATECCVSPSATCVIRTGIQELLRNGTLLLPEILRNTARVNIVISDVNKFSDSDFAHYRKLLDSLANTLESIYIEGKNPQLNLLTDRMMLVGMNNCGAGEECLCVGPDGRFYVCPAFFYEEDDCSVGDLLHGFDLKNPQLYRLDHAPICRACDAYQCKRCVYLSWRATLEVNTPGREKCVKSHLERNASRELLLRLKSAIPSFGHLEQIDEIDYIDPFEKVSR